MKYLKFYVFLLSSILFGAHLIGQGVEINPNKILIDSTIILDGNGIAGGGDLKILDGDGNNRVRIFSQLNPNVNTGGYMDLFNGNNVQTVLINGHSTTHAAGRIVLSDSDGNNKILLLGDYNGTGDGRIITDEIEIKGGSDLAEMFDISNEESVVDPGLLVSLDPDNPGQLMISNQAYDKKIAGIISGANGIKAGILMGQDETIADGDNLVTLSGRTYLKANTSNGAIKIGDSITSSKIAGEAMRASKKKKSRGAIVGKALTSLEDGSGYILVLVSLR